MSRGRYLAVVRAPGVAFVMATSLVARLPVAMANLAIILRVVGATGSYARAGAVTAAYVVGTGLVTPILGRIADRIGRRPVLVVAALVNGAGLIALAFIPVRATVVVLVVAALAGASLPPVAPAVRSLWSTLVEGELRSSLYAFDATMQEATFMAGPSLVALLSTLADPPVALVACGGIGVVGTLVLAAHPALAVAPPANPEPLTPEPPVPVWESSPEASPPVAVEAAAPPRRGLRLGGVPGLGTLVGVIFVFLCAILTVEVTVVAFAGHRHESAQAGLLLAVWASGSMVGGFSFGARAAHAGSRVLGPLMGAAALGFLCLAAAPGVAVLYGLLFIAGMSIAPGFSCIYQLVGSIAPSAGAVEAFSWVGSGIQMGAAAGAGLGGVLVDNLGTRWPFVVAACAAAVTAVVAGARSRHLRGA